MDQPIKVLHVIGGGEFGGAEQHILQLVTNISSEEAQVKVITFYDSKFSKTLHQKGIEVYTLDHYNRFDIRLLKGLASIFSDENPDIIHTHGVKANFFGRLAAINNRKDHYYLVTTIHSLLRYDYPNPTTFFLTSLLEKSTRKSVAKYIAVSESIKEQALTEGQSSEKIEVIHHGIEIEQYYKPEDRETIRSEWAIDQDQFVVGIVARIAKVKGIDIFVEAADQLLKADEKLKFVIIGEGPEEKEIQKQIKQKGLEKYFILSGFRNDIGKCLAGFDCFVSTSVSEGLGLSVLEAMAAEVPVVSTGVGGILDIIRDGENGLLVPVNAPERIAQSILEIKQNPTLKNALTTQAKNDVVHKFSIQNMTSSTLELYKNLIK